jgi:two-component system cell cycle sensor histidine kinase/response regulator CckA
MKDEDKTKERLITELNNERTRIALLDNSQNQTGANESSLIDKNCLDMYREFVDFSNSIILRWDQNGNITFLNNFGQSFFGYTSEEIVGKNVIGTIVPETDRSGANLVAMIRDIGARPERYVSNHNENMRSNGERVWISWTNRPILDERGNVQEILSIGNDHTDLKRIEEELRKAKAELEEMVEERTAQLREAVDQLEYRLLERKRTEDELRENKQLVAGILSASPVGIGFTSVTRGMLWVNQAWLDLFGFQNEKQVLGQNAAKLYPSQEEFERVGNTLYSSLETGKVAETDALMVRTNGERFYAKIRMSPFDPSDLSKGIIAAISDISKHRCLEEDLKEREERYRSLVENSFDGIMLQKGLKITFANNRLHEMLGYEAGELEGMEHWMIYHPDYQKITRQRALARIKGEKTISQYEVKLLRKNGTFFRGEILARTVKVQGEPGVQVWIRDISKQRRSEQAQKLLATAVEQATESIIVTDTEGNIEYANPAFETITGYSRDEVLGKTPQFLVSGYHDRHFYKDLWATIKRGEAWKGQFVNRRKDGTLYQEDSVISPVRNASGQIVNFVSVGRDRTLEIELQKQLFWAQKMEAVGTLAGGIAHDFNNLLQVVLGYSEVMLQRKKEALQDCPEIQNIYEAGKRGAELVNRLLTFSRKVEPKIRSTNINQEVLQVQALLSRTIPKTIKIDLRLSGDLESAQADPSQLAQILMNLAVNARDAMPNGGVFTIETTNAELDREFCRRHLGAKPGRYALLAVSDTGHGMDKETLLHIFEPFFTTKEVGKGTGLGLATVYGIVKQHDGYIICYSEPGHGTTFKIYIPVIPSTQDSPAVADEAPIEGGNETILLVDDENFVRNWGAHILADSGYEVRTAANGNEALEIYKQDREAISLVILDLIMPEMDGSHCLAEILKIDPTAKVLMASGYPINWEDENTLTKTAKGFVHKPYDTKQFLATVRAILDAKS